MKRIAAILLFSTMLLVGVSMLSCDKIKGIQGIVTGELRNDQGGIPPMVNVRIVDLESGRTVKSENASDSGNFLIKEVDPGHYRLSIVGVGGMEFEMDVEEAKDFNLKPGKTKDFGAIVISIPERE